MDGYASVKEKTGSEVEGRLSHNVGSLWGVLTAHRSQRRSPLGHKAWKEGKDFINSFFLHEHLGKAGHGISRAILVFGQVSILEEFPKGRFAFYPILLDVIALS